MGISEHELEEELKTKLPGFVIIWFEQELWMIFLKEVFGV